MIINSKNILAKVKARLAADDPDLEYYTFEKDTIKQTTGRDYTLKEWLYLYLGDFSEDIVYLPFNDDLKEMYLKQIIKEIEQQLSSHIKSFFKNNNNKVDEDTWDEEVRSLKKQIEKHYNKLSVAIEDYAQNEITNLNSSIKLV